MAKTPAQFVQEYTGKAIDYDGAYGVQCVDGFRVFCKWAFNDSWATVNGNASGYWWYRGNHLEQFESVPVSNLKDGDWVIWNMGSKSHPGSHVAMYYHGQEFGQNQGGNRGFCLKKTNFSDALGGLRWRGWESANAIKPAPYAVFRLYNSKNGDHLFTADIKEANAQKNAGLTYEGIAWYHDDHGTPVYRVYNPNSGEHFYTASSHERDQLVHAGWRNEGVAFGSGDGNPVYRLYNKNGGKHFYTTSNTEKNNLVISGWKSEGKAFNTK